MQSVGGWCHHDASVVGNDSVTVTLELSVVIAGRQLNTCSLLCGFGKEHAPSGSLLHARAWYATFVLIRVRLCSAVYARMAPTKRGLTKSIFGRCHGF